ncbi:MAG: NAD(P)H-hydrate epimerase, partial [Candidatus Dormibacteria bacterium]
MRALTAEQMRAADVAACARLGDVALMRAAGRALAGAIGTAPRRVVAFAGSGNNGGDAFAALAELDASIVRLVYARAARE